MKYGVARSKGVVSKPVRLVSILESHKEGDKKVVDEVAPIRVITDEDANKEFFRVEPGQVVYHTSNKRFVIHLRKDPLMLARRKL